MPSESSPLILHKPTEAPTDEYWLLADKANSMAEQNSNMDFKKTLEFKDLEIINVNQFLRKKSSEKIEPTKRER